MLRNKKIIVAIPHSHTWFWTQSCVASLVRNPPRAEGYDVKIIVVDNSPWSPAIRGLRDTWLGSDLYIIPNYKSNKFHASALDCVVEKYDFDYLMALETDVLALRPTWLQWFVDQMCEMDFAVGMWHHERFVNPSCTLYRGSVLRDMAKWCNGDLYVSAGEEGVLCRAPQDELRWGPNFEKTAPLDNNLPASENPALVLQHLKNWISGPFAEKRGWPSGSSLKEKPSGQEKGPGWYEPGQQLYHWAVEAGYTYTVCPTTTLSRLDHTPIQTVYGAGKGEIVEASVSLNDQTISIIPSTVETVHLWGGTRALDILKHPVTCQFVKGNTPGWLAREARFWKEVVPPEVQEKTLDLIRKYGWFYTGQGNDIQGGSQRDRDAAEYVRKCYKEGGVEW